ncbi:MAG: hypothetical protein AAFY60_00695 [Myxococcota bacterium]
MGSDNRVSDVAAELFEFYSRPENQSGWNREHFSRGELAEGSPELSEDANALTQLLANRTEGYPGAYADVRDLVPGDGRRISLPDLQALAAPTVDPNVQRAIALGIQQNRPAVTVESYAEEVVERIGQLLGELGDLEPNARSQAVSAFAWQLPASSQDLPSHPVRLRDGGSLKLYADVREHLLALDSLGEAERRVLEVLPGIEEMRQSGLHADFNAVLQGRMRIANSEDYARWLEAHRSAGGRPTHFAGDFPARVSSHRFLVVNESVSGVATGANSPVNFLLAPGVELRFENDDPGTHQVFSLDEPSSVRSAAPSIPVYGDSLAHLQFAIEHASAHGFTRAELLSVQGALRAYAADVTDTEFQRWLSTEHPELVSLIEGADLDSFAGPTQASDHRLEVQAPTENAAALYREALYDGRHLEFDLGDALVSADEVLERYLESSGQPGDSARVQAALSADPEFQELWDWFESFPGGNPIRFAVKEDLRSHEFTPVFVNMGGSSFMPTPGLEDIAIYGQFYSNHGLVALNSSHPEVLGNPIEAVDTLVHELIHAALHVQRWARENGARIPDLPFADGIHDRWNDPWVTSASEPSAGDQRLFELHYGASPSTGDFIDLPRGAQEYIEGISLRVMEASGVGAPTSTSANLRRLAASDAER